MLKILLTDDDIIRTREISACISDMDVQIEIATTKQDALSKMDNIKYDLIIIDIKLPENISTINPSDIAGVELVEDIERLTRIKKPNHIIGITSDEVVFNDVKKQFDDRLIPIMKWDPACDEWKNQLISKVKYLNNSKDKNNMHVDTVIITAIDEEYDAFKNVLNNWKEYYVDGDPSGYFLNEYKVDGQNKTILLVKSSDMGMTAASNICTKTILTFSPDKVIMVGICGGIRGQVQLGDIIIASNSWDYGNGKIISKPSDDSEGYYEFEAAPNQIPASYAGFDKVRMASEKIIEKIKENWNNSHQDNQINPILHIGPMPSGASVICDKNIYEYIIKPQHRKCNSLDMETYAIYFAAKNTVERDISFLSIKSVSDYADKEKNDSYHKRCCYTSANFAMELLKQGLI